MINFSKRVVPLCLACITAITGGCSSLMWEPGSEHSTLKNVIASEGEDSYRPKAGYAWDTPGQLGPVHWQPGTAHPDYPNVVAGDKENHFRPKAGYDWDTPGQLGPVHWQPGIAHPDSSNVVAGDEESHFRPEAGYDWDTPGKVGAVHAIRNKCPANVVTDVGERGTKTIDVASLVREWGSVDLALKVIDRDIQKAYAQIKDPSLESRRKEELSEYIERLRQVAAALRGCE